MGRLKKGGGKLRWTPSVGQFFGVRLVFRTFFSFEEGGEVFGISVQGDVRWRITRVLATIVRVLASSRHRAAFITVINLKGGVAKTFTVWTIAGVCQERGQRVLLIDCDAQANLSGSFLADVGQDAGVESLFDPATEPNAASLIRRTPFSHIDIIPATVRLARYDLPDRSAWEKSDLQRALADSLEPLRAQYDLILIDCPPRLSVVSYAALCASDFALVPMEVADYGAQGIKQVNAALADVRRRYNPNLKLLGYVVSRYKRARAYQQTYLERLRAHFGEDVFPEPIPDLAYYEQSVCDRLPIVLHRPRSKAAEIARRLVDEIDRRIERLTGSSRQRRRSGISQKRIVAV